MIWLLLGFAFFGVLVLAALSRVVPFVRRPINKQLFESRWHELLEKVRTSEGMVLAIIDADKLVDVALRRRGFRGKTMGERLVSAQRMLSDNDAIWQAHKLRNKLVHEHNQKLNQREVKRALASFKQALRDLGAL